MNLVQRDADRCPLSPMATEVIPVTASSASSSNNPRLDIFCSNLFLQRIPNRLQAMYSDAGDRWGKGGADQEGDFKVEAEVELEMIRFLHARHVSRQTGTFRSICIRRNRMRLYSDIRYGSMER